MEEGDVLDGLEMVGVLEADQDADLLLVADPLQVGRAVDPLEPARVGAEEVVPAGGPAQRRRARLRALRVDGGMEDVTPELLQLAELGLREGGRSVLPA